MEGKVIVSPAPRAHSARVVARRRKPALARGARVAGVDHAASKIPGDGESDSNSGDVDLPMRQAKKAIDAVAAHFGRLER